MCKLGTVQKSGPAAWTSTAWQEYAHGDANWASIPEQTLQPLQWMLEDTMAVHAGGQDL